MTPIQQKNRERAFKMRQAEANDAFDYRWGDGEAHLEKCLFKQRGDAACSRVYDPNPEGSLSAPEDATLYAGTGIGYLYGEDDTERFAWELAGWSLRKDGSV